MAESLVKREGGRWLKLKVIDQKGKRVREYCVEHREFWKGKRCEKCAARKAWSDRVYTDLMDVQRSIKESSIREERYA